jgi:hypothetical protein
VARDRNGKRFGVVWKVRREQRNMTKAERKIYRKKYYQEHKYIEKEKRREY